MTSKRVVAGAFTIVVVVLVTYFPILQSGFHYDDWGYVESIGRLGPLEFVGHSFNPMEPSFINAYRPLQGLALALEYCAYGSDAVGYHLDHIALHIANCLLLCVIVWSFSRRLRLAFSAGLFYATLPVFSVSVFLPTAPDALATLFYLSAIGSWSIYLRQEKAWAFVLTNVLFILGLLTKEIAVTVPVALFLVDRVIIGRRVRIVTLLGRYSSLMIILLAYLRFQTLILPYSVNYQTYGMAIGPHMIVNAARYLVALAIPWPVDIPNTGLWVCLIVLLIASVAIRARSNLIAFAGSLFVLGVAPVIGMLNVFDLRLLYFAGMAPAVVWAWLADASERLLRHGRIARILIASAAVGVLLLGSVGVFAAAQAFTADARSWRAPFRDISQNHPTFTSGTYLYFIKSPFWLRALSGMFFVKYGKSVTVGGTNWNERAELASRGNPLIYYFDSTGRPIQVPVRPSSISRALPQLPVTFGGVIQLEGYELSSTSLDRGDDLAVFLYWRALAKTDKDYQVFVHLVRGADMVDGVDGPAGGGTSPTSSWAPGTLVSDGLVLRIPQDAVPSPDYRLEIGLYHLPTMQQLNIVDDMGAVSVDRVFVESIDVQ